jgi:hypothetical protein
MSFGFGKTENVSESGLLINSPETLPIGSEIELRFVLPLYPEALALETKGKVAWVRPGAAMGIEFVDLKEEYRTAIRNYVSDRKA